MPRSFTSGCSVISFTSPKGAARLVLQPMRSATSSNPYINPVSSEPPTTHTGVLCRVVCQMVKASGTCGIVCLPALKACAAGPRPSTRPARRIHFPRAARTEPTCSKLMPFADNASVSLVKPCLAGGPGCLSVTMDKSGFWPKAPPQNPVIKMNKIALNAAWQYEIVASFILPG